MPDSCISYSVRPDATPQSERDALSQVYAFILQKHRERKKAVPADRPERPERIKDDPARSIIPDR